MLLVRVANLTTTFQLWLTSVKLPWSVLCTPSMLESICERVHGERTAIVMIQVKNKKGNPEMLNVSFQYNFPQCTREGYNFTIKYKIGIIGL